MDTIKFKLPVVLPVLEKRGKKYHEVKLREHVLCSANFLFQSRDRSMTVLYHSQRFEDGAWRNEGYLIPLPLSVVYRMALGINTSYDKSDIVDFDNRNALKELRKIEKNENAD